MSDLAKSYDEWERTASPEELREAMKNYKTTINEYHLSKDYEIEDYSLLERTREGYTELLKSALSLMEFEVFDINLPGQKEIYLLAQKGSMKLIIMGGLYEKSKIIWTEKILNVAYLIRQHEAYSGVIVTNRPADEGSINLANENDVVMIHEYKPYDIIRFLFDILIEFDDFIEESNEEDWYLKANKEYLSKFFDLIGYKVKVVRVIGGLDEEIGYDILINRGLQHTIVKTFYNRSPQEGDIIKEVIVGNKYYSNTEPYCGFYEGGIIISNMPFTNSEIERANMNQIKVIYADSLSYLIWKLLHVYD